MVCGRITLHSWQLYTVSAIKPITSGFTRSRLVTSVKASAVFPWPSKDWASLYLALVRWGFRNNTREDISNKKAKIITKNTTINLIAIVYRQPSSCIYHTIRFKMGSIIDRLRYLFKKSDFRNILVLPYILYHTLAPNKTLSFVLLLSNCLLWWSWGKQIVSSVLYPKWTACYNCKFILHGIHAHRAVAQLSTPGCYAGGHEFDSWARPSLRVLKITEEKELPL